MPEAEVASILPGEREDVAERFDPTSMNGELIEAEHLARYRFAASFASGRRVLDAGCGWAYGSELLARSGAASVAGVDVAESVIEAASVRVGPQVELLVGDIRKLPFPDASFDLVVCFEVIEHIEGREQALAEFARVLEPDGVLVISSPNNDVYGERNPHHVHQYSPESFREFLAAKFSRQASFAQQNWIASTVSTLDDFAAAGRAIGPTEPFKTVGRADGEQTYLVSIASNGDLPELTGTMVLAFDTELLRWNELWEEQDRYLRLITGHRDRLLAEQSSVRDRLLELEKAIADERRRSHQFEFEVEQRSLELKLIQGSLSWRLTRPLRLLKRILFGSA